MKKRTKPVTRDEVMVDRYRWRFKAVPANALAEERWHLVPIPKLWAPLMRQLRREHKKYVEGELKQNSDYFESLGLGRVTIPDPPVLPEVFSSDHSHLCHLCGRKFHRRGKYYGRYCSDVCAEKIAQRATKRKIARQTAVKSTRRAEARAGRNCQSCGEPMEAARSTRRYCSDRCRVANHRANARS